MLVMSYELHRSFAKSLRDPFRKPEATIMDVSESIASSLEEVRNMRFWRQTCWT